MYSNYAFLFLQIYKQNSNKINYGQIKLDRNGEVHNMSSSTITTKDGTDIYYKDWGKGPVVTFSHGWPLNSDAWDGQMFFLAERVPCGRARPSWPWPVESTIFGE
jgi:hypothetical protein